LPKYQSRFQPADRKNRACRPAVDGEKQVTHAHIDSAENPVTKPNCDAALSNDDELFVVSPDLVQIHIGGQCRVVNTFPDPIAGGV
jgi:uncharacterized protein YabE (DUF348 family)